MRQAGGEPGAPCAFIRGLSSAARQVSSGGVTCSPLPNPRGWAGGRRPHSRIGDGQVGSDKVAVNGTARGTVQAGGGPRTHPEERAGKRPPHEEGSRGGKRFQAQGVTEAETGERGRSRGKPGEGRARRAVTGRRGPAPLLRTTAGEWVSAPRPAPPRPRRGDARETRPRALCAPRRLSAQTGSD